MRRTAETSPKSEEIELFRGNAPCRSLFGAFGNSLKETRLTAGLGYIIAFAPEAFREILALEGRVEKVSIESPELTGRSDIRIETTGGRIWVVEAKIPATNPHAQALAYPAYRRILLTDFIPLPTVNDRTVRFVSWKQLAESLRASSFSSNNSIRFVVDEFLKYLKEYNMIPKGDSDEVYLRMFKDTESVRLFSNAQMYSCAANESKRLLSNVRYFAPHFTWDVVNEHPELGYGVSYISRIDSIVRISSQEEWKNVSAAKRGKRWLKSNERFLDAFTNKYSWLPNEERIVLFLGPPRLVFNPPIHPKLIEGGRGFLATNYLSFDDLFRAWRGERLY